MSSKVNKIRNADFSAGKAGPRGWTWKATGKPGLWRWTRPDPDGGGMTIASERAKGTGFWSQDVVCRPERYYRVEATVECDLASEPDDGVPNGDSRSGPDRAGFVIEIQPVTDGRSIGQPRRTPGLIRSTEPIAVCAYFKIPAGVRRLRMSVGLVDASGTACVRHVRVIEILEPEEASHILAIPAPPFTAPPPPRVASSVTVCSATADQRPVTRLLGTYFKRGKVHSVAPTKLRVRELKTDALLLPDASLPRSIRTLPSLIKLAGDRIVVVSLPAFSQLVGSSLSLRRVEQDDDPIHARVNFANHTTRGFALHDAFPYAWSGKAAGSFVQNHFRKTGAMKKFCDEHNFVAILLSLCDQDVTSDRPICLYKETPGGGLFVLDIEPVEAIGSTFGEPTLPMHFLLSLLGKAQSSLGQYVSPAWTESGFRSQIREMPARFEHFVVHEPDLPIDQVKEQLVTIGREDQTFGLPLKPKPVILVRSNLYSGDVESVYGAFVWFKQLVRPKPHLCPYAQQLAAQFRLAWVPVVAPWEARGGLQPSGAEAVTAMAIDSEGADVAALIDIVSQPIDRTRVVFARRNDALRHCSTWLMRLASTFAPEPYFAPFVGQDSRRSDRDCFLWRPAGYDVQVAVDSDLFTCEAHQNVLAIGGEAIRIEVPSHATDYTAHSIGSTDLIATLLEHVIGLQFGLIAVNRRSTPVRFSTLPPVRPGKAIIIDRRDPILQENASQVG